MASISPSPTALPPQSNPNQTVDSTSPPPSNSSAPQPQSSLPSLPQSPPLSPPRPSVTGSPPPPPPASPPMSPPETPPLPPPPSPPASPPPPAPSPASDSPPPVTSSPPPSPPNASSAPLAAPPSSPPAIPPSSHPPPPPSALHSPKHFPPSPPTPQAVPPAPANHSSPDVPGKTPPLPSFPGEKPVAIQPTRNITASGNSSGLRGETAALVGSFVGFLILTLMVVTVWFIKRRRKNKDSSKINHVHAKPSPFESSNASDSRFLKPQYSPQLSANSSINNYMCSSDGGMGTSRPWFTFEELSEATNGYSTSNLLGEGGFGCVYKGVLIDGREVAVKQLKVGGGQGEREFRAEVEIISRIHHRHLVSLVGYCISGNQRLLVYDYVKNNTLHYHLHDKGKPVMEWASRVKVAAGAARGLAYLHEDCQPRIIHRDIKSTNILLDNNFEALVADFGLAKLAMELDLHTHVSTRVMGTFGYLAPEYASSGKLTEKSDVYSFGVVLLELITGRKPVDLSQPLDDEGLVEWARPLLSRAVETQVFEDLIDPRLENNFVKSEMFRMIEAAAACVRYSASKRPRMSQIGRALDSIDEFADLNNGSKPGQSGIFDSSEHSAQVRMFERMAFGNDEYYSSDSLNRSQSSWRT